MIKIKSLFWKKRLNEKLKITCMKYIHVSIMLNLASLKHPLRILKNGVMKIHICIPWYSHWKTVWEIYLKPKAADWVSDPLNLPGMTANF